MTVYEIKETSIRYSEFMKTILFGNGLNLLNGYSTWEDLLMKIDVEKKEEKIPNTLQFEAEVLPLPEKKTVPVSFEGKQVTYNDQLVTWTINSETNLKAKIAEAMKKYETNEIYQRIAKMSDVSHYVTTNYDDVLKRTLLSMGYMETEHIKIENTYSIRRRHSLAIGSDNKHIWSIHGEIDSPQTIMLGLNQYCGSVSKISDYLNGKYDYNQEKKKVIIPKIQERLRDGIESPLSWLDLFFISDIYIMGFSLLYEEIDLWWILTRRKRLMRQGANITNNIFYCGEVKSGKKKLFHTMGVNIIEPDAKAINFIDKYHSILDKIA